MSKAGIFAAVLAAGALISSTAYAAEETEKCTVVGKDGKGIIKAHKADCKTEGGHSCAGQNVVGDAKSWISVPKGMCTKVQDAAKKGDLKGLPQDIQDKLEGGAEAPKS